MTRHLLRDDDLSPAELREILDLADRMKAERFEFISLAGPQAVAVLFDKPSTRTRVSFSIGITELGGYPMVIDSQVTQLGRGESISDTARVLDRQCAAIVWRTSAQSRLEEMAQASTVPVINALSDSFHPCQALADLMTIRERRGNLAGLKLSYLGDGANNMAHSYLLAGATAGMHVCIGTPEGHVPEPEILNRAADIAAQTGGSVQVTHQPTQANKAADVLATDTWVSMGQEGNDKNVAEFMPFSLTQEAVSQAAANVVVLHCLPAYRGREIAADVIDGPHSAVWDEAENRLHVQKALLTWLIRQTRGESDEY